MAAKKKITVDIVSDVVWPFCWVGKRHLETAMTNAPNFEFEVRWLPYQLNPQASEQPSSKTEMYMKKFGKSREEVSQMAQGMAQKFAAVGLPFKTTEGSLVSNTLQAHRILTAAYKSGGPDAQDKAVEVIFNGYFGEGKAPNDRAMLEAAAAAGGIDGKAVLDDQSAVTAEVQEELAQGRRIVDSGVPHFVFRGESGKSTQFSGAHPPAQFAQAFTQITS